MRATNQERGEGSYWDDVTVVLRRHYTNPDIEAAHVLCAALASHALKQFSPAWCLAIAPPGSMKTDFLESFRGLPGIHFVDEVTTNTFLSGKVDDKQKKRTKPASWLHRIGSDGVLIAADFSTFTANPRTLPIILSQLRRIYDGNFSREFGTDENTEERSWSGRLTLFAGAVPDIDRHYSLFQSLGERFVRVRWPRAGGVETGLRAMKHTVNVSVELRGAVQALLLPILSSPQVAPRIPEEIERKIANLGEFITLARTYIERDGYKREAEGVPITEGNTRLPQELCQIARGAALIAGRSEVNDTDYGLVRRVAFDSLPPARVSVVRALLAGKSPHSVGLPKSTIDRAMEDLHFAGIISVGLTGAQLTSIAESLLYGAGVITRDAPHSGPESVLVPELTPR
jgi:hypothetical protein